MQVIDPEKTRKIKQLLQHHPRGMTISDLSSQLKMNRNLMAKYLDILLFSGQLEMRVTGTAKVYFYSHRVPVSALLEHSSDYILVLDAESSILQVNARLLALLGMKPDEPVGQKIGDIDHPFLHAVPLHKLPPEKNRAEQKLPEFSAYFDNRRWYFSVKQVPIVFEDSTYGKTLIFEDITDRRSAEETIRAYLAQQEFFARKLQEFAELPPSADIYAAIGAGLDELVPDALIDINAYDAENKMLRLRALYGNRVEEFARRVSDNHGNWDASPAYDSVPEVLISGKLFHLPGKLHYASFEQVSPEASLQIEKEFNLGDFYSIGLTWRGKLLGNILFIIRNGSEITNRPFIETYARAASIALQRQIAERSAPQNLTVTAGIPQKTSID
jgi:PAS domain S-box-containing protein